MFDYNFLAIVLPNLYSLNLRIRCRHKVILASVFGSFLKLSIYPQLVSSFDSLSPRVSRNQSHNSQIIVVLQVLYCRMQNIQFWRCHISYIYGFLLWMYFNGIVSMLGNSFFLTIHNYTFCSHSLFFTINFHRIYTNRQLFLWPPLNLYVSMKEPCLIWLLSLHLDILS